MTQMIRTFINDDHPILLQRELGTLGRLPSDHPLTERDVQVLRLLAQGLPNRGIAKKLFLSERTVGNYVSAILGKLHLENRTQAALYALRKGLASLEMDGLADQGV